MTPDHPISPLTSLRRHWLLGAVLALLGMACGVGIGLLLPATYTAEARLAVAPNRNSAYTISGFPLAAAELAANYSRWVQNNAADGSWRPAGVDSVVASPIPDSAVVRIETTSRDETAAVAGAAEVAAKLEATVQEAQGRNNPDNAYKAFSDRAAEVAAAQTKVDAARTAYQRALGAGSAAQIQATQRALNTALTEHSTVQLRQDGDADLYRRLYADPQGISQLKRISEASSLGGDRRSMIQRGAVVGLVLGLALALVAATLADRRRVRARTDLAAGERPRSDPQR